MRPGRSDEVAWYILPVIGSVCVEFLRLLAPSGRLVIKQSFLPPGQQKYGNDIVSKPADLVRFVRQAGMSVEREVLLTEPDGEQALIFSSQRICCIKVERGAALLPKPLPMQRVPP